MSEETVGRHVERRTSEDGKQHWNPCLRDLPSMVLQIFEAGWTECLYRLDIREFPEWTVAVVRDFEMENFAWSIVPRADKLAAAICGRFDVNPARLTIIEQHDTSWPWWAAAMLGRHTDRRYWVAIAKDGEHRWASEPADRKTVEDLLQRCVEEEGVRIWQNGEPVALWDWRLRSLCWRFHRPVRTFKER
ncbi:MAG TPA: hypothetical protein VFQ79_08530 [Bryobacteraceae bacterium]|nr:hypothetical protein [Bryobacteraceae bacterium]